MQHKTTALLPSHNAIGVRLLPREAEQLRDFVEGLSEGWDLAKRELPYIDKDCQGINRCECCIGEGKLVSKKWIEIYNKKNEVVFYHNANFICPVCYGWGVRFLRGHEFFDDVTMAHSFRLPQFLQINLIR